MGHYDAESQPGSCCHQFLTVNGQDEGSVYSYCSGMDPKMHKDALMICRGF